MQNIHFHLAYLLTNHECVIVPGLGAFISFPVPAYKDPVSGLWNSPLQSLSFNPKVCHNDGLLANSLVKEKNISFKDAVLQINQYVEQINKQLRAGLKVSIPWIGSLELNNEAKIEFAPASKLSCNLRNYGLAGFYLPLLADIKKEEEELVTKQPLIIKHTTERNIRRWIGASVAAAAAIFLLAIPVNNYHSRHHSQEATMLRLPSVGTEIRNHHIPDTLVADTIAADTVKMPPKVQANDGRYYYIVIASLPTRALAEKKAGEYKTDLFSRASVISKEDKHRVYVDRFEDKDTAEAYLKEFRIKYPKHSKAWLLSQREKIKK